MRRSARTIRALAVLAGVASVVALNTHASATICDLAADQRMLVGTDIVTPMIARVEPISEPRVPLIRVAPRCGSCGMDEIFDDG